MLDERGSEADGLDIKPGSILEIGYDGSMMESYPMRLSNVDYIKFIGQENSPVELFCQVIMDLYIDDPALNSEIDTVAFDLSGIRNLSEAEKSAITYLMGEEMGLITVTGTFDELCNEGYIDRENLYFPSGILFEIATSNEGGDRFTFVASKWRSGLGAIGMADCKAELKSGQWSYTQGSQWIS